MINKARCKIIYIYIIKYMYKIFELIYLVTKKVLKTKEDSFFISSGVLIFYAALNKWHLSPV